MTETRLERKNQGKYNIKIEAKDLEDKIAYKFEENVDVSNEANFTSVLENNKYYFSARFIAEFYKTGYGQWFVRHYKFKGLSAYLGNLNTDETIMLGLFKDEYSNDSIEGKYTGHWKKIWNRARGDSLEVNNDNIANFVYALSYYSDDNEEPRDGVINIEISKV